MELPHLISDAAVVRATIAALMLEQREPERRIGSVTLAPHQISAVARIGAAFDEFGGALLFDAVGVGKTYIGAAIARRASSALVIAPAALKPMWREAARRTALDLAIVTTESLSVRAPSVGDCDVVVVDEAHHFRNPKTRRYRRLAEVLRNRLVLLMSATPIHNSRKDLVSVASLFLGSRAEQLSESEMGRLVIRRNRVQAGISAQFPDEAITEWLAVEDRPEIVSAIRALPAPLPLREAGEATELIARGLVRQWASSEHALAAALKRRLRCAAVMESSLEHGRHPSQAEIKSWVASDEAVQLGFAELLSPAVDVSTPELLLAVRQHAAGLQSLLELLGDTYPLDAVRADQLSSIRRRHRDCRIVAFSAYAATVRAFLRLMSREGGIALLTSAGGRVASGHINRAEILNQFSPESHRQSCSAAMKIDVLLTTDLLSEGVNLQDAGVAIHLDLPWTPARIEQRVGRIARLGSRHRRVSVYGFRPPVSADDFLRSSSVLQRKLHTSIEFASHPAQQERIRAVLDPWTATPFVRADGVPIIAAVVAPQSGFVAVVLFRGRAQLICGRAGAATDDLTEVASACETAAGDSTAVLPDEANSAIAAVSGWLNRETAAFAAGLGPKRYLENRRRLIAELDFFASRLAPARRSRLVQLIAAARDVATQSHGAAVERELSELASVQPKNEEWLRRVVQLAHADQKRTAHSGTAIVAVLLLTRSRAS